MSSLVVVAIMIATALAATFVVVRRAGRGKDLRPTAVVHREAVAPRRVDFPPPEHGGTTPVESAVADPPAELATFRLMAPDDVDPVRSGTLSRLMQRLGKPIAGMQAMLSPEVLETDDSNELAQFVLREPTIAARVLATVNSPFYCLQSPIGSVGQAITFLGMNMTRAVVMRVLSQDAPPPSRANSPTGWRSAEACAIPVHSPPRRCSRTSAISRS
jgi:hypothetical protein